MAFVRTWEAEVGGLEPVMVVVNGAEGAGPRALDGQQTLGRPMQLSA